MGNILNMDTKDRGKNIILVQKVKKCDMKYLKKKNSSKMFLVDTS